MNKKEYIAPNIEPFLIHMHTAIAEYSPTDTQEGDVDPIHDPVDGEEALIKERDLWKEGLW